MGDMDRKQIQKAIERRLLEDSVRGEFEATLVMRVERYLQVKPHGIVPNTHFSAPLAQCSFLYRDGHYYGCIALSQAVAEALVKYMCKKKSCKAANSFEKNLGILASRGFLKDDLKTILLQIWENRDDYHHLNPNVERDLSRLQEIALDKASLLVKVMADIFEYSIIDGRFKPKHPEYWEITGQKANVFLNFE